MELSVKYSHRTTPSKLECLTHDKTISSDYNLVDTVCACVQSQMIFPSLLWSTFSHITNGIDEKVVLETLKSRNMLTSCSESHGTLQLGVVHRLAVQLMVSFGELAKTQKDSGNLGHGGWKMTKIERGRETVSGNAMTGMGRIKLLKGN